MYMAGHRERPSHHVTLSAQSYGITLCEPVPSVLPCMPAADKRQLTVLGNLRDANGVRARWWKAHDQTGRGAAAPGYSGGLA